VPLGIATAKCIVKPPVPQPPFVVSPPTSRPSPLFSTRARTMRWVNALPWRRSAVTSRLTLPPPAGNRTCVTPTVRVVVIAVRIPDGKVAANSPGAACAPTTACAGGSRRGAPVDGMRRRVP
jgi:hypothetical protein